MSDTSLRAELERAVASVEAREAPPPPAPPRSRETTPQDPAPPAPDHSAESAPETKPSLAPPSGDRPRDQFGRFLSKSSEPHPAAEPDETAAPEAPVSDQRPDQPDTLDSEPEPDLGASAIAAPQSWSAAGRDTWSKLPRAAQEEIQRRESEIQRGLQQRAEQVATLEPIAQALEPFREKLALRGVAPAAALQQLLAVQDLLDRDPIQGVAYVARSYGVDLRQYATAFQANQQPQDPAQVELTQRMQRLEQHLQQQGQFAQQQEMSRIQSEVDAFRADVRAHPHFESVRPLMAQLMQSNVALTLQQAYDQACWMSGDVRQRLLDEQRRTEQQARARAERDAADRARRAGVSVAAAPSGNGVAMRPRKGNDLRSDIRESLEEVASR